MLGHYEDMEFSFDTVDMLRAIEDNLTKRGYLTKKSTDDDEKFTLIVSFPLN